MADEVPVVFLAFANAADAHLDLLKAESRAVYQALRSLEETGKIAVHREESTQLSELYQDLLTNSDRVVIFHYGGHANGELLQLEDGTGSAVGLARLLGQQNSLKLVFLNGCATQGHVALLLDAGVPAVIATSVPIGDQKAQEFSSAFYAALATGRSIVQAFESGRGFVEGKYGVGSGAGVSFTRDVSCSGAEPLSPVLEWGLFRRADSSEDLEQWRLPDAQSVWRVQLVDARGPLRDVDGNPRQIEHRHPIRTSPGSRCRSCGTTSTLPTEGASTCPACGSSAIEQVPARTMLAEQLVPFLVSEDEARDLLRKYASTAPVGGASDRPLGDTFRLQRLFVPYWVFDVDTRTTFEAERGWNREPDKVAPKLEWESVRDVVDLALKAYLVPAGGVPVGINPANRDWYWKLDQAQAFERAETAVSCVVMDRPVQSAFDVLTAHLSDEIEAEIEGRVGGQQQRNITIDTRYREVSARTVLLPHWYATISDGRKRTDFVMNGQTGTIRALLLPAQGDVRPAVHDGEGITVMGDPTYEPAARAAGTGIAISIFSGAGIGLMVGALLGLAVSPTVGIFVGAIGTALAGVLGLNDRHFSLAKGIRIGTFGIFAVAGGIAGLYMRNHDVFSPSLAERKSELRDLGYSECEQRNFLAGRSLGALSTSEDTSLMTRKKDLLEVGYSECEALGLLAGGAAVVTNGAATAGSATTAAVSPIQSKVQAAGLMASGATNDQCAQLGRLKPFKEMHTLESVREEFDKQRPDTAGALSQPSVWTQLSDTVGKTSMNDDEQKELLFIAIDAFCGPTLVPDDCQRLQAASANDADRETAFEKIEALSGTLKDVRRTIENPAVRVEALGLLMEGVCPAPE